MDTNNKEREIQKLHKAQKSALYWLLGFIYVAFIGMQLGRSQAITDFDYGLHEAMFLPFTIYGCYNCCSYSVTDLHLLFN